MRIFQGWNQDEAGGAENPDCERPFEPNAKESELDPEGSRELIE